MARSVALVALALAGIVPTGAEDVNPYSASGDSTDQCYEWAANGECSLNPGHMLSQCKYSCWEWFNYRKEKYPDAEIDKSMDCHGWSNQGECHKNPTYMKSTCPQSCKEKGYDAPPSPPKPAKPRKKRSKKKSSSSTNKDEV